MATSIWFWIWIGRAGSIQWQINHWSDRAEICKPFPAWLTFDPAPLNCIHFLALDLSSRFYAIDRQTTDRIELRSGWSLHYPHPPPAAAVGGLAFTTDIQIWSNGHIRKQSQYIHCWLSNINGEVGWKNVGFAYMWTNWYGYHITNPGLPVRHRRVFYDEVNCKMVMHISHRLRISILSPPENNDFCFEITSHLLYCHRI